MAAAAATAKVAEKIEIITKLLWLSRATSIASDPLPISQDAKSAILQYTWRKNLFCSREIGLKLN